MFSQPSTNLVKIAQMIPQLPEFQHPDFWGVQNAEDREKHGRANGKGILIYSAPLVKEKLTPSQQNQRYRVLTCQNRVRQINPAHLWFQEQRVFQIVGATFLFAGNFEHLSGKIPR